MLGTIIFAVGTAGVAGAIIVDVVASAHRRQIEARRARNRDAGSVDYDHEFMKSAPSTFVHKYASAPEAFFDDAPAGGVTGAIQINRNNMGNPAPPVDFAALCSQRLKEWEHLPGDPMPRPEHYDGVVRKLEMIRYAYSVPTAPDKDGRWWLMATSNRPNAKPQPTGNTYGRRSSALKACRQRNEAAAFKAKATPRPIAKR